VNETTQWSTLEVGDDSLPSRRIRTSDKGETFCSGNVELGSERTGPSALPPIHPSTTRGNAAKVDGLPGIRRQWCRSIGIPTQRPPGVLW